MLVTRISFFSNNLFCFLNKTSFTIVTLYSRYSVWHINTRQLLKKIVGKGEIAGNEQFLLFPPQCFLLDQIIVSPFVDIFDIISLFAAELEDPKIGIWGKGLIAINPLPNNDFFWLVQIESICRQQKNFDFKTEIHFGVGRKHCGKRRKCWLPAFSPFPRSVFNRLRFKAR